MARWVSVWLNLDEGRTQVVTIPDSLDERAEEDGMISQNEAARRLGVDAGHVRGLMYAGVLKERRGENGRRYVGAHEVNALAQHERVRAADDEKNGPIGGHLRRSFGLAFGDI